MNLGLKKFNNITGSKLGVILILIYFVLFIIKEITFIFLFLNIPNNGFEILINLTYIARYIFIVITIYALLNITKKEKLFQGGIILIIIGAILFQNNSPTKITYLLNDNFFIRLLDYKEILLIIAGLVSIFENRKYKNKVKKDNRKKTDKKIPNWIIEGIIVGICLVVINSFMFGMIGLMIANFEKNIFGYGNGHYNLLCNSYSSWGDSWTCIIILSNIELFFISLALTKLKDYIYNKNKSKSNNK